MRVGTCNAGDGNTYDDMKDFMSKCDIVGVEEMLDREHYHTRFRRDLGYLCEKGNGEHGQPAPTLGG